MRQKLHKIIYTTALLVFSYILQGAPQDSTWRDIDNNDLKLHSYLQQLDEQALAQDSLKLVLHSGYEWFLKEDYSRGQAELLRRIAFIYARESLLSEAIDAQNEALKLYQQLGDDIKSAQVMANLGANHGRRGEYDQSTDYLLKALEIFHQFDDQAGIADANLKLGTVNTYLSNYELALDYFSKSLEISLTLPSSNVITLYGNMAYIYMEQGKLEESERYFKQAISFEHATTNLRPKALAMINLGQLYIRQGKTSLANMYFDQAAAIAEEHNMLEELVGLTAVRLDDSSIESQRRSLDKLDGLKQRSVELEIPYMRMEILSKMIALGTQLGQYERTVQLYEEYTTVKDQLFNESKARDIANLRASFNLNQSKQEILTLDDKVRSERRMKTLVIVFSIILAIGLLIALRYYFRSIRANRLLEEKKKQLSELNVVKDKLFSIIGHDLKNAIGSQPIALELIRSEEPGSDDYKRMMDGLEASIHEVLFVLDTLLNWGRLQIQGIGSHPVYFNVSPLLANSVRLIGLSAGMKDVKIINLVPEDTYISADKDQFRFILRNLLSNAVKYSRGGGVVEIGMQHNQKDGRPTFFVKDSGIGMHDSEVDKIFDSYKSSMPGTANETGSGIALVLSREFIHQHGGEIWVESEKDKGSTFYISFGQKV